MTVAAPARPATVDPVEVAPGRWLIRAMDTVFSLASLSLAGHADAGSVVTSLAADLGFLEATLSVFRPDSEICRWREGELGDDDVSDLTWDVITACDRLEELTGGLFSARRPGGYDPSGYVKGFALARAAGRLDRAGVTSYCLNGGGDVVARGYGPHGTPWRVGVAHPHRAGELATVVTALPGDPGPLAVATSGTQERGAHVVNPLDGWTPRDSTVTVVGRDIALVDAVATAALAAGRAGSRAQAALVEALGLEAFGFGEDHRPWWTPGMTEYALLP